MFLQALQDKTDGVRWQAALAIGNSGWIDDQSRTALLNTMGDTNELVGAAAVHALVKLRVTNAAPLFLQKLKVRVKLPVSTSEERSPEAKAILQDIQGEENHATGVLDDDQLS